MLVLPEIVVQRQRSPKKNICEPGKMRSALGSLTEPDGSNLQVARLLPDDKKAVVVMNALRNYLPLGQAPGWPAVPLQFACPSGFGLLASSTEGRRSSDLAHALSMKMLTSRKDASRILRLCPLVEFTSQQPAATNFFAGLLAEEEPCMYFVSRALCHYVSL